MPIPDRVVDAVEVAGRIERGGRPVAGLEVAVEQPEYLGPGRPAPCTGASAVTTDGRGDFHSPRRSRWTAWVSLLGESPDWHRPMRVCVRERPAAAAAGWRPIYFTRANGWDPPLRLTCDLDAPPRRDERRGQEGVCAEAPPPVGAVVP